VSAEKELAFRYDLFITPDWRDRFDTLINESIVLPVEGRLLDVNCGTGAHSIEIAEQRAGKGEVIGVDPCAERIALARAKSEIKKVRGLTFEEGRASALRFNDGWFSVAIGDASMMATAEIEGALREMIRVTQPRGRVILKMATHGSFDEFFSIYWEALLETGLTDQCWAGLEKLINERLTISDAEEMARRAGLSRIDSFCSKEEFFYESGSAFLDSPLISDVFLSDWLSIIPQDRRQEVSEDIESLIEKERHDAPFDISIKATLITGLK
jgi:ubiquinone/menaquinone biosynthesis C-methylase UbiE